MSQAFNFGNPVNPDNADGSPPQVYTLGCEWESDVVGVVSGNRWRAPTNSATVACQMVLYRKSDMAQVAISAFFTPTNGVDNDILFVTPFTIAAATRYISGVLTDRYAFTLGGWPFTTLNLTAPAGVNGRLALTVAGVPVFPAIIHASAANFFVGPLFDPAVTVIGSPTVITLSSQPMTPTPGMVTVPLPPTDIVLVPQSMSPTAIPLPGASIIELLSNDLLSCLCEELALRSDPPAVCCVRAGDITIHDVDGQAAVDTTCCPGLAYVRVGNVFNTTDFPTPDVRSDKCLSLSRAVEFTMGVVRCVPGLGTPSGPSCADWELAAIHDANDIEALYGAICCFTSTMTFKSMRGRRFANQISTVSMQADCIERQLSIIVEIPKCC